MLQQLLEELAQTVFWCLECLLMNLLAALKNTGTIIIIIIFFIFLTKDVGEKKLRQSQFNSFYATCVQGHKKTTNLKKGTVIYLGSDCIIKKVSLTCIWELRYFVK